MSNRSTIISNLAEAFGSLGRLVDGLTDEQWKVQSLCPAWTVQGVLVHVTTIEEALVGWRPGGEHPFAAMGSIAAELASLSPEQLVARYHTAVAARLAELETISEAEFDAPSITPVGNATYARFMAIRVFDTWVHERDISVPLGIELQHGGGAAEMSLDEVDGSIGYIVGKKIGLTEGKSIAFEVTGATPRRIMVKVDGRATRVSELPDPTTTVSADTLTFMQLACGRIDPEQAIGAGRITWTGDAEWGGRAARNLAFTM
jgi:uncharacterized protein (TIGR03083 family)